MMWKMSKRRDEEDKEDDKDEEEDGEEDGEGAGEGGGGPPLSSEYSRDVAGQPRNLLKQEDSS